MNLSRRRPLIDVMLFQICINLIATPMRVCVCVCMWCFRIRIRFFFVKNKTHFTTTIRPNVCQMTKCDGKPIADPMCSLHVCASVSKNETLSYGFIAAAAAIITNFLSIFFLHFHLRLFFLLFFVELSMEDSRAYDTYRAERHSHTHTFTCKLSVCVSLVYHRTNSKRVNRIVLLFVKVIRNEILSHFHCLRSLSHSHPVVIQTEKKNNNTERFSAIARSAHSLCVVRYGQFSHATYGLQEYVCVRILVLSFTCTKHTNINHNWFVNRARLKNKYLIRFLTWMQSNFFFFFFFSQKKKKAHKKNKSQFSLQRKWKSHKNERELSEQIKTNRRARAREQVSEQQPACNCNCKCSYSVQLVYSIASKKAAAVCVHQRIELKPLAISWHSLFWFVLSDWSCTARSVCVCVFCKLENCNCYQSLTNLGFICVILCI